MENCKMECKEFVFDCDQFLKRTGFTVKELSEKLGCSSSAILSWKRGDSFPKIEMLAKLIDLGATIFEIFGHEYAMKLASNTSEAYKPEIKKRVSKK